MPGACTSYSYTNLSGRGTLHLDWEEGTAKPPHKNVNFSTRRDGRRIGNKDEIYQDLWERSCKEKRPFRGRMLVTVFQGDECW